jgi:hypothetical protein
MTKLAQLFAAFYSISNLILSDILKAEFHHEHFLPGPSISALYFDGTQPFY